MTSNLTRFVILAVPRSGSNMLCTMLNSHPEILCHHEIFNPAGPYYALPLRGGDFTLGSLEECERDPVEFMGRIWRHALGRSCVGFKMTNRQNERVFAELLADRSIKKIVLERRNRIKTLVSRLIAEQLDLWEAYRGDTVLQNRPRVNVSLEELRQDVETNAGYYRDLYATLDRGGHCFLRVTYEHLTTAAEQARLLDFLGVNGEAIPLKAHSVKQNSTDLRDAIANFEDLAQALRGDALEGDLYDRDA